MPVRTLVVDDDDALRQLLRLTIQDDDRFHFVGEASNGKEAIEAASRTRPDLVLLDLKMPVMDGFEALPRIRKAAPAATIVCLSMLQASEASARVLGLGADAFIDKSVSDEVLMAKLDAILKLGEHAQAN